jgi:protein phosphatase
MVCESPVFLVADGMGGYEVGELASAVAINAFAHLLGKDSVTVGEMRDAYREAGSSVVALGDGRTGGSGTTLSGVAIMRSGGAGYWLVINVGDSRTYRFRRDKLEQLSVDHSVVQELIDAGELTVSEASADSRRNVVTRALTAHGVSEPDIWMLPAHPGDRILVCSDGLTGELTDVDIARILSEEHDPQAAADRLVDEAVAHGGRDNVTAVIVDAVAVERLDIELDEDTAPREREQQ